MTLIFDVTLIIFPLHICGLDLNKSLFTPHVAYVADISQLLKGINILYPLYPVSKFLETINTVLVLLYSI